MTLERETLQQLHQKIARKDHLEASLRDLYAQQRELAPRVEELDAQRLKEKSDVDRLEGRSLAAFFYNVIGKMDEKLDKERTEAYAAAVRYDAAARELAFVEDEIARSVAERRTLEGCEDRYAQALAEKLTAIKAAGGDDAQSILCLEEDLTRLESRKKELNEAISAGKHALDTAHRVRRELDEAGSLATWDLWGGGLLVDMAKHEHLDAAQNEVETLQVDLRKFKTELSDVTIQADIQISMDDFLQFADFFFDGLFADLAVADHITNARRQVERTTGEIEAVLSQLDGMLQGIEAERESVQNKLDALALAAN